MSTSLTQRGAARLIAITIFMLGIVSSYQRGWAQKLAAPETLPDSLITHSHTTGLTNIHVDSFSDDCTKLQVGWTLVSNVFPANELMSTGYQWKIYYRPLDANLNLTGIWKVQSFVNNVNEVYVLQNLDPGTRYAVVVQPVFNPYLNNVPLNLYGELFEMRDCSGPYQPPFFAYKDRFLLDGNYIILNRTIYDYSGYWIESGPSWNGTWLPRYDMNLAPKVGYTPFNEIPYGCTVLFPNITWVADPSNVVKFMIISCDANLQNQKYMATIDVDGTNEDKDDGICHLLDDSYTDNGKTYRHWYFDVTNVNSIADSYFASPNYGTVPPPNEMTGQNTPKSRYYIIYPITIWPAGYGDQSSIIYRLVHGRYRAAGPFAAPTYGWDLHDMVYGTEQNHFTTASDAIPTDAEINGLEVTIPAEYMAQDYPVDLYDGLTNTLRNTSGHANEDGTITFGSAGDDWGMWSITPAAINDSHLAIYFTGQDHSTYEGPFPGISLTTYYTLSSDVMSDTLPFEF